MARIEFGNTWWGKAWLKALSGIDFSNRLPRGVRYARNGSVKNIIIEGNKVQAEVQGRDVSPYKIKMTVPVFSKEEIRLLEQRVRGNHYYMSSLEGMAMPQEIADECRKLKIPLFPSSWEDLKMKCSCPDWAVPCKHLAAVVYTIANEIDKNPFILFNLHGMDLVKIFQLEGKVEEEEIRSITSLAGTPVYTLSEEIPIDLTLVPPLAEATLRLLTEKPLFFPKGDFKAILAEGYKRVSKETVRYLKESELEEEHEKPFHGLIIEIHPDTLKMEGSLKGEEKTIKFKTGEMTTLTEWLRGKTAESSRGILSFLVRVYNFALILLKQGAFVPEILATEKETYLIRWIPSLFNRAVREIFEELSESIPQEIVSIRKKGATALKKEEQLLFTISLFLSHYLELFSACKEPQKDTVTALFFNNELYTPGRFGTRENPRTINLWLSRFFIRPRDTAPVIKIEEQGEKFQVSLYVKEQEEIKSLEEFLASSHKEKFPLLKDLNLLATYLPVIETILKNRGAAQVSAKEFAGIWFDSLGVLKTLGINTLLPRSLKEVFIPRLTLSFKTTEREANITSYLSLKNLINFQWSIAIGDKHITVDEFNKLVSSAEGIVKYKNEYLFLDPGMIGRIEKQMAKDPALSPLDMLRIHFTGEFEGSPIEKEKALEELLTRLFTPEETLLPKGLKAQLRPYQEVGYRWLYHNSKIGLGSLIADDMGLGKTLQIITLISKWQEEGVLKKKKILIIAPATLLTNWEREIKKFAPKLSAGIYHGAGRKLDMEREITLTTYSLARQDLDIFKAVKWQAVILDEAQNIKNPGSDQTMAVKTINGEVKIAMTGTPVENRLMDYWSILDYTVKKLLGTRNHFKEEFALPIEKFRDQKKLHLFRRLSAPFILRRLKTDKSVIKDLPEKTEIDRFTGLTPAQAALYQNQVNAIEEMLKGQEGIGRKGAILKLIMSLKQICNHPANYTKTGKTGSELSGKSLLLLELLEKYMERNEKTIIFTQFREMGNIMEEMLHREMQIPALFLHGGLSRTKRDEMVDRFQKDPLAPVMILSLKAGGTGLNLTAASTVIHYDLWWNPAVEAQATDRAFRIGQKRNVMVYRFVTKDTFEEKINDMIKSKKDLANLTVKTGENWITEMSNKELKALLTLKRED